jgi:hypothetical protein
VSGYSGIYFRLLRPSICLNSCIDARLYVLTVSLLKIKVFCGVTLCYLCNLRHFYATPCDRIVHSSECRTCIFYHKIGTSYLTKFRISIFSSCPLPSFTCQYHRFSCCKDAT